MGDEFELNTKVLGVVIGIIGIVAFLAFYFSPTTTPAPPTTTPAPPPPDIIVVASFPDKVNFGSQFVVTVVIQNNGGSVAENVHLYLRANPSGYFIVVGSSHTLQQLVPAGIKIKIGSLYPGDREKVTLTMQAPTKSEIGNKPGMAFEFTFSYDYYEHSETVGDKWVLTVGPGLVTIIATPGG